MVMLVVIEGVTDAKLHINLYIDKQFTQKVKIVTYFVKQAYRKNIVTLQQEIKKNKSLELWNIQKVTYLN